MEKKVILFHATYCGKCYTLKKRIERLNEKHLLDYEIEVHDIDIERELAKEYFVDGVPTMIVFNDGVEVSRLTGSIYKEELMELNDQLK